MKKWVLTLLAALTLLALAWKAKLWVPWLLSFAVRDKEQVDSLKGIIELVTKLLTGAGAIFLPIYHL
jgi:hypothetical protein